MKTGLSDDEMARIRAALEAVPAVEKAVLFGSRAMGLARSNSDVDILLYGDALQTRDVLRVASLLDATTLPYQFDLIRHDTSNVSLLEHVREYGKVIFQRQEMVSRAKSSQKSEGIASEWCTVRLGELGEVNRGRSRHRPRNAPHLYGGSYPFIQTGDIKAANGLIVSHTQTYSEAGLAQSRLWPTGTMVITIAANIAETAILSYPACFPDSVVGFIADKEKADVRFIEFLFRFLRHQIQHENVGTGSVQDNINLQTLERLELKIPDLNEQHAIAHILGTLDDKIELNRRMNETLEAMARALFKAWFVDFEPVRAKLSGRWRRGQSLPGLPAHLYDLFPDRLVESELGEIPEEWKIGALGDVAEHPRRSVQPGEIIQGIPYIALEHMPKRCITLAEWDIANGLESNKYLFKHGEILFGKLRPYFHKVGIAPLDGICSTDIVVIAPKSSEWLSFTLTHVSSDEFVEYTNAGSTGTKMPRTSWSEMSRYTVILPPKVVSAAFDHYLRPVVEEIIAKIHESKTLAQLRDTLLPKLISGELHTKNVNGFIEETIYD